MHFTRVLASVATTHLLLTPSAAASRRPTRIASASASTGSVVLTDFPATSSTRPVEALPSVTAHEELKLTLASKLIFVELVVVKSNGQVRPLSSLSHYVEHLS